MNSKLAVLAGTVSEAVAREFVVYTDLYADLPNMEDILRSPATIQISDEPSVLYALSNMIAAWATTKNIKTLMLFISRLPIEFGTIALQNLSQRNPQLLFEESVSEWVNANVPDLF